MHPRLVVAAGSAVLGLMQRPTRWMLWLGLASVLVVSLACSNGQDGPAAGTATPATGPTTQITIPEKTELKHPKVGSMLDDLIARVEAGEVSAEDAAQEAPVQDGDSVAVTIDLSGSVEGVLGFLEGNGGSRVSVGEDYIEAFVPVLLLGKTAEQPGVLRVRVIVPGQLSQGGSQITGNGPEVHGSPSWNQAGYRGQGIKVGVIDGGFLGFSLLMGTEVPKEVRSRCYPRSVGQHTTSVAVCESRTNHGTVGCGVGHGHRPGGVPVHSEPLVKGTVERNRRLDDLGGCVGHQLLGEPTP